MMTFRDIGTDIRSMWEDVRELFSWNDPEYEYWCLVNIVTYDIVEMWWDKERVWPKVIWYNEYKCLEFSGLWLCVDIQFSELDYK